MYFHITIGLIKDNIDLLQCDILTITHRARCMWQVSNAKHVDIGGTLLLLGWAYAQENTHKRMIKGLLFVREFQSVDGESIISMQVYHVK